MYMNRYVFHVQNPHVFFWHFLLSACLKTHLPSTQREIQQKALKVLTVRPRILSNPGSVATGQLGPSQVVGILTPFAKGISYDSLRFPKEACIFHSHPLPKDSLPQKADKRFGSWLVGCFFAQKTIGVRSF